MRRPQRQPPENSETSPAISAAYVLVAMQAVLPSTNGGSNRFRSGIPSIGSARPDAWIENVGSLLSLPRVAASADPRVPFVEVMVLPRDGAPSTLMDGAHPLQLAVDDGENPQSLAAQAVRALYGDVVVGAVPVALLGTTASAGGVAFVVKIDAQSVAITGTHPLTDERRRLVAQALRRGLPDGRASGEQQGRRSLRDRVHRLVNRVHRAIEPNPLPQIVRLLVGQPRTFLDIACGDDELFLQIAASADVAVGNDPAGTALNLVGRNPVPPAACATAFDAADFPRTMKFDVTLAKCVVHHLADWLHFEAVMDTIAAVTNRRAIVIDIERPTVADGGVRTAGWNWYYRTFLNDSGTFFPGSEQIFSALRQRFGHEHVTAQVVPTARGRFLVATIDG